MRSHPGKDQAQTAGQFYSRGALCIAKTRNISPDFLDGLSEPLNDSFDCFIKYQGQGFKNNLKFVGRIRDREGTFS